MSHLTAFFGQRLVVRLVLDARAPRPRRTAATCSRLGALALRVDRRQLDDAVGAVALAVAAADAAVADEDLAVGRAVDRVGRAILHAVRMLAVAARRRHVQLRVRRAGLAVQARGAVVRVGAGLLAVVAADAQALVDQQHVGRLADALLQQVADDVARLRLRFHLHVVADAVEELRPRASPSARDGGRRPP